MGGEGFVMVVAFIILGPVVFIVGLCIKETAPIIIGFAFTMLIVLVIIGSILNIYEERNQQ